MALARAREVAEKGRRFSNFVEMIYFAEQEVKLFLKARSRIIQMTDSRDGILKMAAAPGAAKPMKTAQLP